MSTLEKLVRAFEALKVVQLPPAVSDEAVVRRREKTSHCITIADAMCTAVTKNSQEFSKLLSISIETLLQLCSDPDSNVRMVADESLNRIIRALMDNNVGKIQLELHKEIKKNGNARTLRAALWRFAELCHMIRPQKGKPYMQSLVPCIEQIASRQEELVQETLALSVEKIFKSLGIFATDNEIKILLRGFFHNLSSVSAVTRRSSASAVVSICLQCKKPQSFLAWSLNSMLESVLPIREDSLQTPLLLGALGLLRNLLPHLNFSTTDKAETMRGSFGKTRTRNSKLDMPVVSVDHLLQIYELSLHFALHQNHNVANASLECLQQLLRFSPPHLTTLLFSPTGINRSRILDTDEQNLGHLKRRTFSQISISHSIASDDASVLLEESLPEPQRTTPKLQVVGESQSSLDSDSLLSVSLQPTQEIPLSPDAPSMSPTHVLVPTDACDGPEVQANDEDESPLVEEEEEGDKEAEEEEQPPEPTSEPEAHCQCDVGTFCDAAPPLVYCTRLLASTFLLTGKPGGLRRDREVRVSVKALALSCVAGVVSIWPDALTLNLDKADKETQPIHDILLYCTHSDPQLRGCVSQVVGSLLKTVLMLHENSVSQWARVHDLTFDTLLKPLYQGLQGESSVSCRQTLATLKLCLGPLLESQDSAAAVPLLAASMRLCSNPYWLVKVRLLELLAEIPFVSVAHVTQSCALQQQALHAVLLPLLADEDARVRHTAVLALAKVIPMLFFETAELCQDPVTVQATTLSQQLLGSAVQVHQMQTNQRQNPDVTQQQTTQVYTQTTEGALSRVVYLLSSAFLTSTTRHSLFGCCEAVATLSDQYPTAEFPRAWNCVHFPKPRVKSNLKRASSQGELVNAAEEVSPAGGLFSTVLSVLTTAPSSLDLSCQQWLLHFAGNLFTGLASCCLRKPEPADLSLEEQTKQQWGFLKDKKLAQAAEQLLTHAVRVLAMFAHALDETAPVLVNFKSQTLPSIPSPIKRKNRTSGVESEREEKNDEKRGSRTAVLGYFMNSAHCVRIFELLKSAYTNYKLSLESQASEKFLSLLHTTLQVVCQILEVASLVEVGRCAEELLGYLRVTVTVEPVATVACVQQVRISRLEPNFVCLHAFLCPQLLRSLFGTNFGAQCQEMDDKSISIEPEISKNAGFYDSCYQIPYRELSLALDARRKCAQSEPLSGIEGGTGLARMRDSKSPLFKSKDRVALASYIKLFEPMVIKALEQYTVTSDVGLQCRVLQLLSQLVQLRVNYCLLDSDKIFIGFVRKQFELIEEGHILNTEALIPRIFHFLVHLSYEKNHSKAIISVPEVIQLCDGLMASGQPPITHCIPALVPVVEDIFLMRGGVLSSGTNAEELDTQREVLVVVLLRLLEYPQVLDLLALVLRQSCLDNRERWLRWSKRVAEDLLPLMAQYMVHLETRDAQIALRELLDSLAPSALQPIDPLLHVLFSAAPGPAEEVVGFQRWLGGLLGMLSQLLVRSSEEEVISRVVVLNLDLPSAAAIRIDPLNASRPPCTSPPETLLTRLMFQIVQVVAERLCGNILNPGEPCVEYLKEQLAHLLLYYIYMLESGGYCKMATCAIRLVQEYEGDEGSSLPLASLNQLFVALAPFCPLLTFQWCYVLILLGHSGQHFWAQVLRTPSCKSPTDNVSAGPSPCCNLEIVRRGGIILFSDYVCDNLGDVEPVTWLLVNHIEEIIRLSKEVPVQELIAAVHRNPAASGLLVQAVAAKCHNLSQPRLVARLLQNCLEGVHPSQSGALLQFLALRLLSLPQVALTRKAGALACKRAEMLLTASPAEVEAQLSEADLQALLLQVGNKHERLRGVLRKLGTHLYNLPADHARGFDPLNTKTVTLDAAWFYAQVKQRSCHPEASGSNVSKMLAQLSLNELLDVIASPKFNLSVLNDCVKHGCQLSLQQQGRSVEGSMVSPLLEATQASLVHRILRIEEFLPRPHQVFQPVGRPATSKEHKFTQRLATFFGEPTIWQPLLQLARTIPTYFDSMAKLNLYYFLPTKHWADFARFGVLCLEASHWQVAAPESVCPGALEATLSCAASVLSLSHIAHQLAGPANYLWLASACSAVTAIARLQGAALPSLCHAPGLVATEPTKDSDDADQMSINHACTQIATLVAWLESQQSEPIPRYLYEPIRLIIIGLARLAPFNSYASTPPAVWQQGWDAALEGATRTIVPPIPISRMLDIELLEQFIFRLSLLGWTSRQQFEENWMALLGVLNCSHDEELISPEESSAMAQVNVLAVRGITALLLQSMLLPTPGYPATSSVLHQPRELARPPPSDSPQLRAIQQLLNWHLDDSELAQGSSWQFHSLFQRANLERVGLHSKYGFSQVSLQYLVAVTNPAPDAPKPDLHNKRMECLKASGIDIHSCLQFLLDLFQMWLSPQSETPLRLQLEAVRSILVLSDMFTERSQFHWMLHTFLDLGKTHSSDDELVHQFLALGVCKAAAVLLQDDAEVLERVRKMAESSLRSGFLLPSRLCGLHGLLYLLQAPRCGSRATADETLPLSIEYIQRHMDLASGSSSHSERHLLALWALVFFLLEEEQVSDSEMAPAVLQLALALISTGNQSASLNTALVQGLERLVLCGTLSGPVGEQVTALALDRLRLPHPVACVPALQLLLTCMYTGDKKLEQPTDQAEFDPEVLLKSLEKTSTLFDRIKRGYPHEVDMFCGVLPTLLKDFFPPSEMLTKVLGEFLSNQQPHPKLLAGVVFKLFEQACEQDQLPLLQHWVVLSLSNFTQGSPIGMAVWYLSCFFVSASTNSWLRALFPYIQSRIGRCDTEERRLLCLAARDFYHKLSESQQRDFMSTFQAAATPQSPFCDIISCL